MAGPGGRPGDMAGPGGRPGGPAGVGIKAGPAGLSAETVARAKEMVALYPEPRSALIPICHLAQAQEGWLTPRAMIEVAALVGITPAEVLGTASFYDMLHTEPVGRYLIGVCTNIACLLNGGQELLEHAEARLGINTGATTGDGLFTLEELECVAYCDRAPCATVNWRFFGPLSHESFDALVEDLGAGRLDGEVPRHGVLSRVSREGGLRVDRERVTAERARADEERQTRKAAEQADQAATEQMAAKREKQ